MPDLPTDWSALCALVFLLGMRHGLDADHLAAINGFTRLALRERPGHARYCGALFCLGHGAVVAAIALLVGLLSAHWVPPAWVATFGNWVSIGFLLALGVANLQAVLTAAPRAVVALVGFKGPVLSRLAPRGRPLGVAAVGALFALSFDTLSQAALFALTATQFGGPGRTLALALLFVLGMLLTDGLNGWWTARLIARADGLAAVASRVMGLAVAGISLLVAASGIGRLLSSAFEGWSGEHGLAAGGAVIAVLVLGYLAARALALHPATRPLRKQADKIFTTRLRETPR